MTLNSGGMLDLNACSATIYGLLGDATGIITDLSSSAGTTVLTLSDGTLGATMYGGHILDGPDRHVSLVLAGAGTLVLSASNDYTGGTIVQSGARSATDPDALPDGTGLTLGGGATYLFGDLPPSSPLATAAPLCRAPQLAAVPEPGTCALLLSACLLWVGVAVVTRSFAFYRLSQGLRRTRGGSFCRK